jgi:flagellar hook-associated protein 3 FlgL
VTHTTIQHSTLRNLQTNLSAMARLQGQLSSGSRIAVPSDDPAATGQAMQLRATSRQISQYTRNATDGDAWLTTVDTALTTALKYLRNARDLVVQSGNGGLGQNSLDALANDIDGLRDGMLAQANTRYLGRTVFAGTSDAGVAFTSATDVPPYVWQGTAGATVDRRVGPSTLIRVDTDGSAAFGDGTNSVFALLDTISSELRGGSSATDQLDAIDARMQQMLTAASSNGSRQKVVESMQSDLSSQALTVKTQLSGVEDIDMAEVLMQIQMQEVVYQGALSAGARVLQPSLLDFLQ